MTNSHSAPFRAARLVFCVGTITLAWGAGEGAAGAASPAGAPPETGVVMAAPIQPLDMRLVRPPPEPAGPSSRSSAVAISEVMYHPPERADGKNLEFIELFNSNPWPEDISGYRLDGAVNYRFPSHTVMPPLSYLTVAAAPADVEMAYGIVGVLGPFEGTNGLANSSGDLQLRNRAGAILLKAHYADDSPWPAAADGAGHSLVLARPSYGENDPRAWAASAQVGGSPGTNDFPRSPTSLAAVMINELFANSDGPEKDFIEIFNYSIQAVDLAGCILTDHPVANKYVIPPGTMLAPLGLVAFDEAKLGFGLNAEGETVYLKAPDERVLDAVRFGGQERGIATGRSPDGAPGFSRLASRTPGAPNSAPRRPEVVINEIMYQPLSGEADDEFIELHNCTTNAISVGDWKLENAVTFTIPQGMVIPPAGYLVVARNAGRLLTNHAGLTAANTVGNFSGKLANEGDRITLLAPEVTISTNLAGGLITNRIYYVVNEVAYGTGGRWGRWSAGGGSSLELRNANADNQLAPNWGDSDEEGKSDWLTVEHTGVLDLGSGPADSLHLFLQGAGECLVDNVEVLSTSGVNLLANSTFESNATGWFFQGSHERSSMETNGGFNSNRSLRVRASTRGDPGANKIRTALKSPLGVNQTATIRAKVRWLRGDPEILFRLHGNYLEATATIVKARGFGTPGARNSIGTTNAGPAITDVTHDPVLPAVNQPVTIIARATDPEGVLDFWLDYRLDPATNYSRVAMINHGAGLYSATIPGQASGTLAAFCLEAVDRLGAGARFPLDAPARECLVRWGETTPRENLQAYRVWLTKARVNRWIAREKLSNEPLDATFVYGSSRPIYNVGAQYSGSPVHAPGYDSPLGNVCDYALSFPEDDRLLGDTDFTLSWAGQGGCEEDRSRQAQQAVYWMSEQLGLPYNHHRFVHMFFNGVRRGTVFEDMQQPNSRSFADSFPDTPEGHLYKCSIWFEFPDNLSSYQMTFATLQNFTTTGGAKKVARYRWNWQPRAARGKSSEFAPLFALVDAANTPASGNEYGEPLNDLIDAEHWMRTFALQHAVGNLDIYGSVNGQNVYAFKPDQAPWRLMVWDLDLAFGGCGEGPTTDLFRVGDPTIARMFNHAPFRRAFWRALDEIARGPFLKERLHPVLDARYTALLANGISAETPATIKSYVEQRRNYILQQLAPVNAPFALTGANQITTSNQLLTISGTAPVNVKTITVNGVPWPVTWTSVKNWQLSQPLAAGTNQLLIEGLDRAGAVVSNATQLVQAVYTGVNPAPADWVVINEILCQPVVTEAAFVEIYNASPVFSFDLSGWSMNGLDFAFPPGSVLTNGQYAVIAKNRTAFQLQYGAGISILGEYPGELIPGGKTLTLIKPGAATEAARVIDRVKYGSEPPWPADQDPGASLQLRDPRQDNSRVSNWSVDEGNWRFASVTGVASSSRLILYLSAAGDVYLDNISLVAGPVPEAGANLVRNGDFESSFHTNNGGPWIVSANLSNSVVSTDRRHRGAASLHVIATRPGGGTATAIWQDLLPIETNTIYTLSYWYLPSSNGVALTMRLTPGSGITSTMDIRPSLATPGARNTVAETVESYPPLWLNEVQPENPNGLTDAAGEHEPWIEIHNSGPRTLSLAGFFLADNYTNLAAWPFPADASIMPGEYKVVVADGDVNQSTPSEWHTAFRLRPGAGTVALSRLARGEPEIVDYLNYHVSAPARAYGAAPDGQPFDRMELERPTPGASNHGAPPTVSINEWMAANTDFLRDPADQDAEDWFELYNPGSVAFDLGGCFLTDKVTNARQFKVPANGQYQIPPKGFLLVWADDETGQNSAHQPDLHANFRLNQGGESIALFAPDGSLMDTVTFGPQTNNVSEGRFPDGAAATAFMIVPTPRAPNKPASPTSPPTLGNVMILPGPELSFSFGVTPGRQYRLEYKDDLSAPAWTVLGSEMSAGMDLVTITLPIGINPQRFYRVVILE